MNVAHTARVDFNTRCENSSRIHIVLTPVGQVNDEFLHQIPVELGKVPLPNRNQLSAKFILQSQPLLSDWSDVQYYRRPIGLLCVTHAAASSNLSAILPQYEKIKRRMETTVIDSRCIIFSQDTLMLPSDCIRPDVMVIQFSGTADSVHCEELTALIGEFTQALYSVIVRDTIEMSSEKYAPQLLYSPYERSKSGLDDGKLGRKRIQARHKKHLGDMFLIISKPEKALEAYEDALRSLLSIGDSLWTGAAFEGQCCAISRILQLEEVESIQLMKSDKTLRGSQESLNSISSEPEIKSSENIIRLFRLAINHMEKIRESSLILLESTLKFVRLMIDLNCKQEACNILNIEIFYSYEDLTAVEKLQFFCTIAKLYQQMGMNRKYCFFLRRAALESIHEKMLSRAYTISSSLLCSVIEMYGVQPGSKNAFGWPQLQKLVLDDLISCSDKLANSDIVVKYGMCLLQNFYHHLDEKDQLRILNLIFKNNTRLGSTVLEVPNVPICKKVTVKPLGKILQPNKKSDFDSVFLYNPNEGKNLSDEISWVCDEYGEVQFRLENPLLHSLQLFDVRCMVEGSATECYPYTTTIYPKQTLDIVLSVKPQEPGKLRITGLQLQICGVHAFFKLQNVQTVNICKPLPLLTLQSEVPSAMMLYEGETVELSCSLVNNSRFDVEHLDVVVQQSDKIFNHSPIPLPILTSNSAQFTISVDTNVGYAEREKYFEARQPSKQRRGTIYENSSGEEQSPVVQRSRSPDKVDPVYIEHTYCIQIKYFDAKREFFRQLEVKFSTKIVLLCQVRKYEITNHPTDSGVCQWHLSLLSVCPQRIELDIAGSNHHLDSGELLACKIDIDRRERASEELTDVQERKDFADRLDVKCRNVGWKVGDKSGNIDMIEAVPSELDLSCAFTESLSLSCEVSGVSIDTGKYKVPVGSLIALNVTITNISNSPLSSVLLFVRCFHKSSSGSRTICDIPFIGTSDCEFEVLPGKESRSHSFGLMPLTCGEFSVEVGASLLPNRSDLLSCEIQELDSTQRANQAESFLTERGDFTPIVPRKIIMQYLNEGLSPPKYIDSWKMRPSLNFYVERE